MPTARKQAFIHILREGFKNFYSYGSIKDNKKEMMLILIF